MGERVMPIDFEIGSTGADTSGDSVVVVTEGMSVEELVEIVDRNSSRGRNGIFTHPDAHSETSEKADIAPSPFARAVDLRQ